MDVTLHVVKAGRDPDCALCGDNPTITDVG
jgi:hypothetical protein